MHEVRIVSVPVLLDGLGRYVTLESLRDLVEATDDVPEHHMVEVLDDELRYLP